MGKRSAFPRIPRDLYRTFDPRAVAPLLPHLAPRSRYVEPCAGAGDLVDQLTAAGHRCLAAFDIEPLRGDVRYGDAFDIDAGRADLFITNPPWKRRVLHALIWHLSSQRPTWLLFDADWAHTGQSARFMQRCRMIVSVGRVRWIPETTDDGKENCAWHLFDASNDRPTIFVGRAA